MSRLADLLSDHAALWRRRLARERVASFGRFLLRRFLDDRCFETAGALSYTTVFALVPLTAVAVAILSAFPVFQDWVGQLSDFVFTHFVPSAARTVEDYLLTFAEGANRLTLAGVLVLVVTAALTLSGIETTFNRIWRVETPRPALVRFLVYWTVLTLGVLLVTAALALTSYLYAASRQAGVTPEGLGDRLLPLLPWALELLVFTMAYIVIPNRRVALRHGLAGGVLAMVLFELAKFGFALYLRNVPSYQVLYGAMAVVPIFLLWVYLSWVVVLLGASFAASLSAFRYQPASMRLPPGHELFGLLRLLGRLQWGHRQGQALGTAELQALEPGLTDDQLHRFLADLVRIGVVVRAEAGGWVLGRDLDQVSLGELYEATGLRVPSTEARLPCRDDPLGKLAAEALDALRLPLRDVLRRPVGPLIDPDRDPRP